MITLRPGRERSLLRRHPWLFSGAIASVADSPSSGDTIDVLAHDGRWLARAAFSPESQIRARVWSFDRAERVDEGLIGARLGAAVLRRGARATAPGEACRLVFSESDGLPGLVVDRYDAFLVCQILSAGAERWRMAIAKELAKIVPNEGVFERSDAGVRRLEGLPERTGTVSGREPPERIEIREGECRFLVDPREGHKTGFYLDQRENRALVQSHAGGADVLNCFSYTGGFGIVAAAGGARSVTNVETSASANALARVNAERNGIPESAFTFDEKDVFQALRDYAREGRTFDLVVLDPPKFADSAAHVERAARGYKDLNLLAFSLLRPGGRLFTFSCSGHVQPELFQKIVADAALDAGRDGRIERRLEQSPDHPTLLSFPEASYLKGLVVRV